MSQVRWVVGSGNNFTSAGNLNPTRKLNWLTTEWTWVLWSCDTCASYFYVVCRITISTRELKTSVGQLNFCRRDKLGGDIRFC